MPLNETLPDGLTMRPPTVDDVESLANMFNAYSQMVAGRPSHSVETVQNFFTDPIFRPAHDACMIVNEAGQIVGYVSAWNASPYVETSLQIRMHPEYANDTMRKILLNWAENHAQANIQRAPDDAKVSLFIQCFENDSATANYLRNAQYEHVRNSYLMSIDLSQAIPEPQFPADITVDTLANFKDLRKVIETDDEAFRDHWGYVAQPMETMVEEWQHWTETSPNIDFKYWYLAMAGDEIAGISLCKYYLIGEEDAGYVHSLAVRKNWRRQGIALALLYHSFREMQKLGRRRVTLHVDASNLTGATRLYEKAGMQAVETTMTWEKILRTGQDYHTLELED